MAKVGRDFLRLSDRPECAFGAEIKYDCKINATTTLWLDNNFSFLSDCKLMTVFPVTD